MSGPVASATRWTLALLVDVVAVAVAAVVLGWDSWCPDGVVGCPTAGAGTDRDAVVLALLGLVLLAVAVLALLRGRMLLLVVQLVVLLAVGVAASALVPDAVDRLRVRTHLAVVDPQYPQAR